VLNLVFDTKEEHRLKVTENRTLRRLYGPRRNETVGGWIKLRDEKLNNVYSSPNIIRMSKSWRIRLAEQVARMVEQKDACSYSVGKQEGKNNSEDLDVEARIIFKWILQK
jgi:hypothetical protein